MRGDLYEALHQLVFGDDEPQYTYTSTRNYDEFDPSRDSWSEITVELADLQPLWSRRETGREDNQKEQATSVKRFSERNVMRWFCEKYLPGLVAAGREPNRDQMVEDTRAEFGDSVPVKFVHQLRSEYAPEKWKKGGRRKSGKK